MYILFNNQEDNFHNLKIIYDNIGEIYYEKGEYNSAFEFWGLSLIIRLKNLGYYNSYTATSLTNIGGVHWKLGEYDLALDRLNKSLNIRLKVLGEEHLHTAISYNNIGVIYLELGEYNKSIMYINNSLSILKKNYGEQHHDVATCYNNIGLSYSKLANFNRAFYYYEKSLKILLNINKEPHPVTASIYNNIGEIYNEKGDYNNALEYYNKALDIKLKSIDIDDQHPDIATSYNNIGGVYYDKGLYDKALEYYNNALDIRLKTIHPVTATIYNNIGLLYYYKNDNIKSLENFNKSLIILLKIFGKEHPLIATCYNNFSLIYSYKSEYYEAIEYLEKALDISRRLNDHNGLLITLNNLSLLYHKINKIPETIFTLEEAVAVVLKARTEIVGKDKQSFTDKHIHFFKSLVELYNQTGQYKKAYEITEKMRGLSVLEHFQLQFALKESGVEKSLSVEMLNRKGKIESLYSQYSAVLKQGEKSQVYAKSLKDQILLQERELEELDKNLIKSYPEYAKNRKTQIPELPILQKQLGNSNKTLIEYTLNKNEEGKENLTAFVISKDTFEVVSLGSDLDLSLKIQNLRKIISKKPENRNFLQGKTIDNQIILFSHSDLKSEEYSCKNLKDTERTSCSKIQEGTEVYTKEILEERNGLQFQNLNSVARINWKKLATIENTSLQSKYVNNTLLPQYLKEIYSICIQPLYDKNLLKTKDILISPDSSIYTIPFSALMDKNGKYWNEVVNLSMIHSASIWMKLKESSNRNYPNTIYAMGNPFYSKKHSEDRGVKSSDLRSATETRDLNELILENLPGSAEEIQYISKEILKIKSSEHIKEGIAANKQELVDSFPERKPRYKTVHFSVHGLFFPDAEELNSLALTSRKKLETINPEALKRYETESKKKVPEDGFLKMGDVIDLGIKTDLVVMSACETSLGSERAGEGMVGLPQAFLMAGSQNTLATLWSVDDKGTMEFFKKFYSHYISKKDSLTASRSLQMTQSQMYSTDNKYKDPYYWSAFMIYGE